MMKPLLQDATPSAMYLLPISGTFPLLFLPTSLFPSVGEAGVLDRLCNYEQGWQSNTRPFRLVRRV